jgi:hypothetical protein
LGGPASAKWSASATKWIPSTSTKADRFLLIDDACLKDAIPGTNCLTKGSLYAHLTYSKVVVLSIIFVFGVVLDDDDDGSLSLLAATLSSVKKCTTCFVHLHPLDNN